MSDRHLQEAMEQILSPGALKAVRERAEVLRDIPADAPLADRLVDVVKNDVEETARARGFELVSATFELRDHDRGATHTVMIER